MPRRDCTGIPSRSTGAKSLALQHLNVGSPPRQCIGAAHSDHTAAHHEKLGSTHVLKVPRLSDIGSTSGHHPADGSRSTLIEPVFLRFAAVDNAFWY